ncbi:hypothetical protein GFT25_13785 [Shigella boydii]|nr:hypothetical protein [Shigella boydii]
MSWAGGKTFRVEKAVTIYSRGHRRKVSRRVSSQIYASGGSGMGCGRGIGSGTGTGSPGIGSGTGICK